MKLNISFFRHENGFIYCQIYFGGNKATFTTHIHTNKNQWSKGKPKGEQSQTISKKLNHIRTELEKCFDYLKAQSEFSGLPISPQEVKDLYLSKYEFQTKRAEKSILEILQELTEVKFKEGLISQKTKVRKQTQMNNIRHFLNSIGKTNLSYDEVNYQIIESLINFIKYTNFSNAKEQKAKKNTYLRKYIQFLNEGNEYALMKGYCRKHLPKYRKFKNDTSETLYLLQNELKELMQLDLSKHCDKELEKVRDLFVFMSFTGFLWSDCQAFNPKEHIISDNLGREIIVKPREKTKTLQKLPLYPQAKAILEKYGYILPLGIEQKYNEKIKQILQMIGIENAKAFSMRSGRKTAGMVWLNAGIRIEVVSAMLGHKNIAVTQKHYAKILNETILNDSEKVGSFQNHFLKPTSINQETSNLQVLDTIAELVSNKTITKNTLKVILRAFLATI